MSCFTVLLKLTYNSESTIFQKQKKNKKQKKTKNKTKKKPLLY